MNSRGQVDLIDMQSQPDGNFKWILNYQDHFTKFIHLRPLERKSAIDVATTLLDIFLMTNGAPNILQSDNGREFVNKIITELTTLWPDLKLVHGRPRHPQSQGSVEKANDEVHKQLVYWMRDNNSTNWTQGLRFVQFQKNSSHHSRLNMSPCEAVYGNPASIGLTSSSLPKEVLHMISTEEDLQAIMVEELNTDANVTEADPGQNIEEAAEEPEEPVIDPQTAIVTDNTADSTEIIIEADAAVCSICDSAVFDAVVCSTCSRVVHGECSIVGECHLCALTTRRSVKRKAVHQAQEKQAKKMVESCRSSLQPLDIGDNVRVTIPRVDRERADPANLIGVVMSVDDRKLKIGTSVGCIDKQFSLGQVEKCAQKLLQSDSIPDRVLSLRAAVTEESVATGQGFIQCNCKTGCHAGRCKCRRQQLLCNSRCHKSMTCSNK